MKVYSICHKMQHVVDWEHKVSLYKYLIIIDQNTYQICPEVTNYFKSEFKFLFFRINSASMFFIFYQIKKFVNSTVTLHNYLCFKYCPLTIFIHKSLTLEYGHAKLVFVFTHIMNQ